MALANIKQIDITTDQPDNLTSIQDAYEQNTMWVKVFNPLRAIENCFQEWEKSASARTTRNTLRQYRMALYDFLEFAGATISADQEDVTRMTGDVFDFTHMKLHTPAQINQYIVTHCIERHDRSAATIKKNLAPIRFYIKSLKMQSFLGVSGNTRLFVIDCKDLFELALQVNPPAAESKSSESAGQQGVRLNLNQINAYTEAIDRTTLLGKRDAAIFHCMLVGTLRVAEVARMTIRSLRKGDNTSWEIKVRRKRNNMDAVGFDDQGYQLIMDYVIHYNNAIIKQLIADAQSLVEQYPAIASFAKGHIATLRQHLEDGTLPADPRIIRHNTPIWQPLKKGDNPYRLGEKIGAYPFRPHKGISTSTIRRMIVIRTPDAVSKQIGEDGIRPHDLRRTYALNMAQQNVPIPAIQRQMGHANAQTTSDYIGHFTDLSRGMITNYFQINYGSVQPPLHT